MIDHDILRFGFAALLLVYMVVEIGWGGGDPNHPDHNTSER